MRKQAMLKRLIECVGFYVNEIKNEKFMIQILDDDRSRASMRMKEAYLALSLIERNEVLAYVQQNWLDAVRKLKKEREERRLAAIRRTKPNFMADYQADPRYNDFLASGYSREIPFAQYKKMYC